MMRKKELLDRIDELKSIIYNQSLSIGRLNGQLQNTKTNLGLAREEIQHLHEELKTLEVVHTTFENNASFDTVVFQRYGKPPVVYKNGRLLDTKIANDITIKWHNNDDVYETAVDIHEE